jgi:hypothetical protein
MITGSTVLGNRYAMPSDLFVIFSSAAQSMLAIRNSGWRAARAEEIYCSGCQTITWLSKSIW